MNKTIAHVAIINSGKGVVGLVHKAIGMFRLSGAADILYFVYNSNVKYNKDVHVFFHIMIPFHSLTLSLGDCFGKSQGCIVW